MEEEAFVVGSHELESMSAAMTSRLLVLAMLLAFLPAMELNAQAPAPRKDAAKAEPDDAYHPEREELAVRIVMESAPKTPEQLLQSVNLLIDLGRPPLAGSFMKQLAENPVDDATSFALAEKFGSAVLFKIAAEPSLQPEGGKFVDAIMIAAQRVRLEPNRLNKLVKDLSNPAVLVRQQAGAELNRAHGAAVTALLTALADPTRQSEHRAVKEMLIKLGDEALEPLTAALDAPNERLQTEAAQVLGQLQARGAVLRLATRSAAGQSPELRAAASEALRKIAGVAPAVTEVERLLAKEIERLLELSRSGVLAKGSPVEVWQWSTKNQRSEAVTLEPLDASLALATQLGRDLAKIAPNNDAYRRLSLTAELEAAKYRNGLDKPLTKEPGGVFDQVAAAGPDFINNLLAELLANGQVVAATGAAEVLGEIGYPGLLTRGPGVVSPLADAARNSNRRLRFAAMEAVIKIKPIEHITGSSFVTDSLAYFIATSGAPRALVGHPRSQPGQTLAGMLAALGYDTDLATNSRQAFNLAVASPDYEFALFNLALDHPPVDELLKQLRKDPRTRRLPVGIVAPLEEMIAVERLARNSLLTEAFPRAHSVDTLKSQVEQLMAPLARHRVSHEERAAQAALALNYLYELTRQPQTPFDLTRTLPALERAVDVPELSIKAVVILGNLNVVPAQRILVEIASRLSEPLAVRQAAALAFQKSVMRNGTLLTSSEILMQYDLYNASAQHDRDTQDVLASILDTIEARKKAALEAQASATESK